MNLQTRIDAFIELGKKVSQNTESLITGSYNPWFTESNLRYALNELGNSLTVENLLKWTGEYPVLKEKNTLRKVAVIMAGNIPLVGFHDFLSVLITGNMFIGKLSSKDDKLLPSLANLLIEIEPEFINYIRFSDNKLSDFDAVIATGSNNSARYFEYYFGKYPHIIRKNRNSAGVLTGDESDEEIKKLCDDIFVYFGLGCRSVSKLFLPEHFNLDSIFKNSLIYKDVINHNKYSNNYDYNKAVYLLENIEFKDNGMMLMKEDIGYASPVSVVFYERYSTIENVKKRLQEDKELIQCVVSNEKLIEHAIPYGESQKPKLWDYADDVDTVKFLTGL